MSNAVNEVVTSLFAQHGHAMDRIVELSLQVANLKAALAASQEKIKQLEAAKPPASQ